MLAGGVGLLLLLSGGRTALRPLLLGGLPGLLCGLLGSIALALFVGLLRSEGALPYVLEPLVGFVLLSSQWLCPAAGTVVGYRTAAGAVSSTS